MQENRGKSFRKSYCQGENVYKCAKYIRKMKWLPVIWILLYLRDIESKESKWHAKISPNLGENCNYLIITEIESKE